MLHMKMLHHFNTVTAHTLVFDTRLWQSEVIQLAFQVRLPVSRSLEPCDPSHRLLAYN